MLDKLYLAVFHHYRHYEGLRLLPSVCEQIIIQQTLISHADKDTTFLSNAQIQPSFHPIYAERFNPNRLLGPARILYNYLLLPSLAPRKKQGYVSFLQIIVQNIKKTFGKKVVILQAERKNISNLQNLVTSSFSSYNNLDKIMKHILTTLALTPLLAMLPTTG